MYIKDIPILDILSTVLILKFVVTQNISFKRQESLHSKFFCKNSKKSFHHINHSKILAAKNKNLIIKDTKGL